MPRRTPIALTTLEAREVPAAGPFADIFPGVWGSYPHDFTTSGKTLFFAADNGHGDEVYASDGTAAGTHLVKDLSPTARGSNPQNLTAAGNGVVFFTADDGTGRALFRSDGSATGTAKVPGAPAGAVTAFSYPQLAGSRFRPTIGVRWAVVDLKPTPAGASSWTPGSSANWTAVCSPTSA